MKPTLVIPFLLQMLCLSAPVQAQVRAQAETKPPAQALANVMDFGAYGDGVRDDLPAVNRALGSISGSCGVLYFPTGKYFVSSPIVTRCNSILGQSRSGTVLIGPGNKDVIFVDAPASNAQGSRVRVADLALRNYGSKGGYGEPTAGACVHVRGNFATVENVWMSTCFDGVTWEGAEALHILNSDLFVSNFGVHVLGGVNLWLSGLDIELGGANHAQVGLYLEKMNGTEATDVQISAGKHSVVIEGGSQFFGKGIVADVAAGGAAWEIRNTTDFECDNCWAAGSGTAPGAVTRDAYGIDLSQVSGFRWTGGFIRENFLSGIHLGPGNRDIDLTRIHFSANGHNNKTGSNTYGILVDSPVGGWLDITDNLFGVVGEDAGNLSQNYGVYFAPGSRTTAGASAGGGALSLRGNRMNFGKLTNALPLPAMVAGNGGAVQWSTGSGSVAGACATGSLYSSAEEPGKMCTGGRWVSIGNVQAGTPASSSTPCAVGQTWVDRQFAYFCVALDTVLRTPLARF